MIYLLTILGGTALITIAYIMFYHRTDTIEEDALETPPRAPTSPVATTSPEIHTQHPKATLRAFCEAIRDFEGKPGDASYNNNNPGNVRFHSGGYLPIYGNVKCSPAGFAIFPTYDLGWMYLTNMVKQWIKNHPNWSIYDFVSHYAPASDNNPVKQYATFIANRLGVDIGFKLKDIVLR